MVKGIIFDLGWTLMYYDGDWKAINELAAKNLATFLATHAIQLDTNFPALLQAARERTWKRADETGVEQTLADALRETLAPLGYSLDGFAADAVRIFFQEHEKRWTAYSDAMTMLQALAQRGLKIGLISNADDVGLVHRQVQRLGFAPYLAPVRSSAEEPRWRKPDPRIFQLVAEQWHIAPNEIVMVGDAPLYDVLGAHRAGMRAIWIDRGDGGAWQKIPDAYANDPAIRADAIVNTLAEIPAVIEDWRLKIKD